MLSKTHVALLSVFILISYPARVAASCYTDYNGNLRCSTFNPTIVWVVILVVFVLASLVGGFWARRRRSRAQTAANLAYLGTANGVQPGAYQPYPGPGAPPVAPPLVQTAFPQPKPEYQQPGYQQPGYQQPEYRQPEYQQPIYPPPSGPFQYPPPQPGFQTGDQLQSSSAAELPPAYFPSRKN